ncbi:MAG: hypothetical protein PWQ89_1497 [Verrucomicrobiota bacterium]|jgi:hypothetical protein|nr:hypothetical protein [Verrucomicrobiota bacterium]
MQLNILFRHKKTYDIRPGGNFVLFENVTNRVCSTMADFCQISCDVDRERRLFDVRPKFRGITPTVHGHIGGHDDKLEVTYDYGITSIIGIVALAIAVLGCQTDIKRGLFSLIVILCLCFFTGASIGNKIKKIDKELGEIELDQLAKSEKK